MKKANEIVSMAAKSLYGIKNGIPCTPVGGIHGAIIGSVFFGIVAAILGAIIGGTVAAIPCAIIGGILGGACGACPPIVASALEGRSKAK